MRRAQRARRRPCPYQITPPPRSVVGIFRGVCLLMTFLLPVTRPAFAADQSQPDRGREVYQKWCLPCHGTGLGKPGTSAAAAHGLNPAVLEQRADLTPKMIETAVRNGRNFMPRFRKTEISNADLAAITAYLAHK